MIDIRASRVGLGQKLLDDRIPVLCHREHLSNPIRGVPGPARCT